MALNFFWTTILTAWLFWKMTRILHLKITLATSSNWVIKKLPQLMLVAVTWIWQRWSKLQMMKNIVGQSLYQLVVVFGILFYGDKMFDIESGRGAGQFLWLPFFWSRLSWLFYRTQRCSFHPLHDGVQRFCHDDPLQRDQRQEDPWPAERVPGIFQ